jgi:hypothetical protein
MQVVEKPLQSQANRVNLAWNNCQRSLHNKEEDRQMSCNDYTIELIATQLVTPENNIANHSLQGKKYSAVRTALGLPKMSKTTKYSYSTTQCYNVYKL